MRMSVLGKENMGFAIHAKTMKWKHADMFKDQQGGQCVWNRR